MRTCTLALALLATAIPVAAHATGWGTLQVAAEREWTTEKEPRPRVTKFRWVEPDRVLEARHGFVSRLQFGEGKFADTVQRMVLDPKTGKINVTYTYEDGRPPLKTVMTIGDDGSLVETFTDAKGVKKRNIYKSPAPNLSLIERQEMRGTTWASLGVTRKGGLTYAEIAEIARRKEQERLAAIARETARIAAERARRQAEENARYAEAEQDSYEPPMMGGMTPLDVLNGLASSINQQNQVQQRNFDRQMQSYNSGGSGGGSIVVDNAPTPTYTPPAPTMSAQQVAQPSMGKSGGTDPASIAANNPLWANNSSGQSKSQCTSYTKTISSNYANSGFDIVATNAGSCTYDPAKDPYLNHKKSKGASKVSGQ